LNRKKGVESSYYCCRWLQTWDPRTFEPDQVNIRRWRCCRFG